MLQVDLILVPTSTFAYKTSEGCVARDLCEKCVLGPVYERNKCNKKVHPHPHLRTSHMLAAHMLALHACSHISGVKTLIVPQRRYASQHRSSYYQGTCLLETQFYCWSCCSSFMMIFINSDRPSSKRILAKIIVVLNIRFIIRITDSEEIITGIR